MKLELTHLPFVEMTQDGLDYWESAKATEYSDWNPAEVTFVSIGDLKEKARQLSREKNPTYYPRSMFAPLIWNGTVGFMSKAWIKTKYPKKTAYNYRFGTGLYGNSGTLLFVEDIFDWAHHRKEKKDVRSAYDFIWQIYKGELTF